ncbi:MAG: hypothetical protein KFB93_04615 [Simkaniaceae bacterium]|nr:MAG: hypothetical protein KFB93_04615 [Simkaniaceae bacterium]
MSTITHDQTSKIREQINNIENEISKAIKGGDGLLLETLVQILEALLQLEDMLKKDHRPLGTLGNEKGVKEVSPSSSGSTTSTQSIDDLRYIDLKDKKQELKLLLEEVAARGTPLPVNLKALFTLLGLSEPIKKHH